MNAERRVDAVVVAVDDVDSNYFLESYSRCRVRTCVEMARTTRIDYCSSAMAIESEKESATSK